MVAKLKTKTFKNNRGMAMIETLPILVIFMVLISYGLGMFGVIHSAILQSIGSRTYAFETFRNRTNIVIFRENGFGGGSPVNHYAKKQVRVHGVTDDTRPNSDQMYVTKRPIAIGRTIDSLQTQSKVHNEKIRAGTDLPFRNREENGGVSVSPAWIMVGYGICLNAQCGD